MPAVLAHHSYGKSRIRLTKVTRLANRHDIRELLIEIRLEGDFAGSYTSGDNRLLISTDTMKNVAYALAKDHPLETIEDFAAALAGHFLKHAHVSSAVVRLAEQPLDRITIDGQPHPHAFCGFRSERRITAVTCMRDGSTLVESGLDDLFLLKSAGSGFSGFMRDVYTTLPDCSDRIFATTLEATWTHGAGAVDWNASFAQARRALVSTFADHQSLSVQQTLYAMGEAALGACAQMERITLAMPNKHRFLVDLKPFGLANPNEIFVATDEPFGRITATLERAAGTLQRAGGPSGL